MRRRCWSSFAAACAVLAGGLLAGASPQPAGGVNAGPAVQAGACAAATMAAGKSCGMKPGGHGPPGSMSLSPCHDDNGWCSKPFALTIHPSEGRFCANPAGENDCIGSTSIHEYALANSSYSATGKNRKYLDGGAYFVDVVPGTSWGPDSDTAQVQLVMPKYFTLASSPGVFIPTPRSYVVELQIGGDVRADPNGYALTYFFQDYRIRVTLGGAAPPTPKPKSKVSLSVSLSSTLGAKPLPLGDQADVTATVTAVGGSVKGVSLGKGLTSSPAATVAVSPSGLSGFSLAKGQSRPFRFKVKGDKPGTAVVSVDATGTTSSGAALRDSASLKLRIGGQSLSISLKTTPSPLKLKVGGDGSITPGEVTVTATLTNKTKATITGAQLLSLSPVPADPTEQLDQLAFPRGTFPAKFPGSLAPGARVSKTFVLKVTGDGDYELRALALFDDRSQPGGNGRATATGGDFQVVVPLLFFTANLHRDGLTDRNGTDWIKGGDEWYVGGRIKNLSSFRPICLSPLVAETDGNAEAVGLQDVSIFDATSAEPPVAGLVKPGQSYPLGMLVVTSSTGSTNGSADVPVKGFVADRTATCELQANGSMAGAGAPLKKDQTEIEAGSTSYVVHVDVSVSPDTAPTAGLLNFFGGFAKSSFHFYAGIARGLAAMAKSAHDDPQFYVDVQTAAFNPLAAARLAERANAHMMAITQLLVNYLKTATPAESQDFFDFVAQTLAKVKNDAYDGIAKQTEVLGRKWYGTLLAAEESGDANKIWAAWAELAGEGVGQLNAIWLQLFVEHAGVMLAARSAELEKAAAAATGEPKALTTSKGGAVPAGRVLSLADEEGGWAISAKQSSDLNRIAQEEGVLIGARSRQAVSIELEGEGAVWKNSNFHQKTVGPIDATYLGMKVKPGLLAARSFTPAGEAAAKKAIFADRAAGRISANEALEALGRLEARIAENGSDLAHLRELANLERNGQKGWVNAGFNANESGVAASRTSVKRWRRFQLEETPILAEDGKTVLGTLYQPFEESVAFASAPKFGKGIPPLCKSVLNTVLCAITGDIDLVYVTNLYGGSLSPTKMLQVFKKLEAAGFAHTDLVTWTEQQTGKFFFPGKQGQLNGLTVGKEACVQYGPDGVRRATYLAPMNQAISTGSNTYQLPIIGGYNPGMR